MGDLIPGLNNQVAGQCLMRLSYDQFSNAANVSRTWKAEIKHPCFHPIRRASGITHPVIVVQVLCDLVDEEQLHRESWLLKLTNHLMVFNLKTGCWSNLPPVPELRKGIPLWSGLAGVGTELVVIGGIDSVNNCFANSVFIFNFISGKWRRGADIPGEPRLDFGCASDSERMVYVAGGSDKDCNPSKNLMAYDVVEDKWMVLPNMAKARDSCQVLFHGGKLHVNYDYSHGGNGPLKRDVEVFDVQKSTWGSLFSEYTMDLGIYLHDGDGWMYKCCRDKVILCEGINWQIIAELPRKMSCVYFATIWQRELILVGATKDDGLIKAYVMNLDNYSWKILDVLHDCTWFIESGCYIEI